MKKFSYEAPKKNEFQKKAAQKKADKEQRKKDREAAKLKIEEQAMEEIRAKLAKEVEAAKRKAEEEERVKREAREKARKETPAKFPKGFNDDHAKMIVRDADFTNPNYVETGLSKGGTMTRRAFVHYQKSLVFDDFGEGGSLYYDCWIGANAHPDDKEPGGWAPGNSYILEYPGFSMPTSPKNVAIIKDLPASLGEKPAVL